MLVRVLQFLIGAVLAGGGGYLGWINRAGAAHVFPPGPEGMPWMLVAGVAGVSAGLVFLVSAVHPRPQRKAQLAAQAEARDAKLSEAEAYYSERDRAADRDWRSGDISAPAEPKPAPEPVRVATPPPAPPPPAAAPPSPPPPPSKPVATSMPPPSTPFPATATLAPIPKAAEPPPAPPAPPPAPTPVAPAPAPVAVAPAPAAAPEPVAAAPAPAPAPSPAPTPLPVEDAGPFGEIRAAIKEGRLDDADKLLAAGRETATGAALAELTALAGDHAAAAGRQSNAKWLWRLALKRFGELGAMDSAVAQQVAESLRVAG